MKIWELTVTHFDYNRNNIKNIEVNKIEEELIPIEFTDIVATHQIFENDDFKKPLKTNLYFKNGSRLFDMMDNILDEIEGKIPDDIEPFNFYDLEIDFKSLRNNLRNEYPEFIV